LVESFSSDEDFFFFKIFSSSSSFFIAVDFKRFVGGGLELAANGAERFFYLEKQKN